ncbi:hypothetical protein K461DRAFT_292085 [Myriangium duriaei CBS 260.36]|uniref:Large ribosomal subunit protein mL49 n=1 Tax=Myriangium duriaei CBS 260.36 TaxID=1168546 RepID=A0A9P4MJD8_9PEZI|nr:hypothetical protein K461DRAFT_292085 [Myriangium duriaei CBS 260.36]
MMPIRPSLAFLQPLPLPRPATVRFFVRRISQRTKANAREDPNLVASRSVAHSYPPPSLKSQPRPKESRSSHRTSQPTRVKNYPDKNPMKLKFQELKPITDYQKSPNLPYYVTRTPSNELPVYNLSKAGGNKPLTRVRKIDGDLEALRTSLQIHLQLKKDDCVINQLTKQVIVKGHVKNEIEAFLKARNF